jgi:hypothetical protein
MDARARRVLATLAVAVLAVAVAGFSVARGRLPAVPGAPTDTARIGADERRAGLRFAPAVAASDREWILAAIAKARPEAQVLVAEVDGLTEMRTHRGLPIGYTSSLRTGESASFTISFDTFLLNGRRASDRDVVVLHELGHAVDFALVPQALNDRLEAGIPRTGTCVQDGEGLAGSCALPAERFADTFAKWALRGGVSALGAGYGIATPASLEDWGAPLATLAGEVARR